MYDNVKIKFKCPFLPRMLAVMYRIFKEECVKMLERVCEKCWKTLALKFCTAAKERKLISTVNRVSKVRCWMSQIIVYLQKTHKEILNRCELKIFLSPRSFDKLILILFADHVCAVNPFIKRIPDDMKDEFVDNLISEIMSQNVLIPLKNKNSQEYIILKYDLLIAYVQKPSGVWESSNIMYIFR